MKTAHLTSLHQSQDIRIFHKECTSLAKHGYDVSLVVKAESDTVVDGVKILAIPAETSRLRRFFLSSWKVYQRALESGADVCHFHDPELIFPAVFLRAKGKKIVYDVHEDLPRQILSKDWIHPFLRYPVSLLAAFVEWMASRFILAGIVAATPKIASRFPSAKTVLVQNFPVLEELKPCSSLPWNERSNVIAYIGGIGLHRGALEIIKAFAHLQNRECRLVLAGPFESPELKQKCQALPGWTSVEYHPWLNRQQVRDVLGQAKIGLNLLHPIENYKESPTSTKMFEYMAAGIPVIASNFPRWRAFIEKERCGLVVDPLEPKKIAKAIDWLLEHPEQAETMGKNGMYAVMKKYAWENEEKKLLKLYARLKQEYKSGVV